MSGTQGLIGFEGCCCSPEPEDPCGADVDDFEFDSQFSGAPYYINPATFYARFSVQDVYINMGWYEPYSIPTGCQQYVDDDGDCCGGSGGLEVCCSSITLACDEFCLQNDCRCCEDPLLVTGCGGTQGVYFKPNLYSDLNVDGDGTARMCCNCPFTIDADILYSTDPLSSQLCTYKPYLSGGCNSGPISIEPCPNQAEDVAFLFSGNFTFAGGGGPFQYKIPCDNSTISAINSDLYGEIDFVGTLRSGTLQFSMANVDFWQGATHTTCNTLMLRFTGQTQFCNSDLSPEKYGTATWAKKYSPLSNLKTAGTFVTGRYYKIKVVGTTSFTSIGAASNTVGIRFQATGNGAGTGTAYLARTEAEAAIGKSGLYSLRAIDTESISYAESDAGDHTWVGIERRTAFAPVNGVCTCHDPLFYNPCYGVSTPGSCGGAIQVDYPTCYNMYTDVMPNITNIVNPPPNILVTFT